MLAAASPLACASNAGGAGLVKLPLPNGAAASDPALRSDALLLRVGAAVWLDAHDPLPLLVNEEEAVQPDVLLVASLPVLPAWPAAAVRLLMLLTVTS
jgi:hypothetical protein